MSDPFTTIKKYDHHKSDPFKDSTDTLSELKTDIESTRTFGVELEVYGKPENVSRLSLLARKLGHTYGHDGSIRFSEDDMTGIEIQTSILNGKEGEEKLTKIMEECKKLGLKFNGTCGTHVHLGGGDFLDKNEFRYGDISMIKQGNVNILFEKKLLELMLGYSYSFKDIVRNFIGDISYALDKPYTNEYRMESGKFSRFCLVPVIYFNSTYYLVIRESTLTKMGLSQKQCVNLNNLNISDNSEVKNIINPKDVVLIYKEESDKFNKLKKLFYFYTVFNNVLFSMLPQERRSNNFCKKLSSSYNIRDIAKCKNQGELEKIWYQKETYSETERSKNSSLQGSSGDSTNRDSSVRYHSINFHSLYYKHGTVEIRMHHGTLNAKSLLMWVKLHQKIMDSISDNSVEDRYITDCANGYNSVYEGGNLLINALNVKGTDLETFIKHRIKKYN